MRRLGATFGRRSGRRAAEAGAQRRAEAVATSIRRSGSCARSSTSTPRNALRVPRARAAAARERALVRPGRGARPARRHEGGGGAQAGRAGAAGGDRRRLGEGARFARERRRGAGEGAGGRADERRRRCCRWRACTRAPSAGTTPARRWSGRRPTRRRPAEIAEIQFRNAQILRARGGGPDGDRAGAAARARRRSDPPRRRWRRWRRWRATAKDDERLVQLLELGLETAADDDERRRAAARDRGALRGPAGAAGGGAAAPGAAGRARPERRSTGREQLADALVGAGRVDDAAPHHAASWSSELTKARRGKDAARWHTRLGMLSEARGDMTGGGGQLRRRLQAGSRATRRRWRRSAAWRSARGDFERARKYYRSLLLQNFDEKTAGVSKAEVYLMLGRMHVLANEIPKARNMFERGLESRSRERRPQSRPARRRSARSRWPSPRLSGSGRGTPKIARSPDSLSTALRERA